MDLINIAIREQAEIGDTPANGVYDTTLDSFAETQKRMLLDLARDIRKADNALDKLTVTVGGLGLIAAALRKEFGKDAVEDGCPAFEMLEGFASGTDTVRARQLFDDLLRDLNEYEADDYQTWLRLTWMLTPNAIGRAILEARRPDGG